MLIEFSVSNFRSFREKQTFSMVAAPRLGKKENLIKPQIVGEKFPNLLKMAAIYGPNATGKSNFVKAFEVFSNLVRYNSKTDGPLLPITPFRFDNALRNEPSIFEVHFINDGKRYEFYFEVTQERIVAEKLIVIIKGKDHPLYSRRYISGKDEYSFDDSLEGGPLLHEAWQNLTSSKAFFISQAVANSNESLQQLRTPYNWLISSLRTPPSDLTRFIDAYHLVINSNPDFKYDVELSSFLSELDVPIKEVKFELNEGAGQSKEAIQQILDSRDSSKLDSLTREFKTTFTHTSALGDAEFDFEDESDGTRNLAGFSFLWKIITTHTHMPSVHIIDELDSSLHPKIVEKLVKLLHSIDVSSQIIFTTHDTHLMNTKLLRRDQIWVTERDMNGATKLHSVYDFDGRESEDVEKRYYEGRYRGLPILG